MNIEALTDFLAAPAGLAMKAMLLWAFIDFATGMFAAAKDGTFALDTIGAFIRKHLLGRVGPIAVLLAAAHFTGDVALAAPALLAAGAYTIETMSSVKGNFMPPKKSDAAELRAKESAAINPVPTD